MQTITHELKKVIYEVVSSNDHFGKIPPFETIDSSTLIGDIADAVLKLRGFAILATDETQPVYGAGLDWALGHGQDVDQHIMSAIQAAEQSCKMFEKALGFGSLPWDSTPEWTAMRKFVAEIYSRDRLAFGNYIVWRKSKEGKYLAMSNKQIRMHPKVFMDTGWPDFDQSSETEVDPKVNHNQDVAKRVAERLYHVR